MLPIPDNGMLRSINQHNIKFNFLCDWIEGSILFNENEDEFSMRDVVDILVDESIYEESDFAMEIVGYAWQELEHRLKCVAPRIPFSIANPRLKRVSAWQDTPAHSFCVLLSLGQCYKGWWNRVSGPDYNEQGELFELLTQESLREQFLDWQIKRTGSSYTQSMKLHEVVHQVASWLGRPAKHDITTRAKSNGKDAGLDLLCYRSFSDNRAGFPIYLMQCASGQDWDEKLHTPDPDLWQDYIDFVVRPQKAFAIPYALSEADFREQCILVKGLFLDRYRLLAAARCRQHWESPVLTNRIVKWATPRVDQLSRN